MMPMPEMTRKPSMRRMSLCASAPSAPRSMVATATQAMTADSASRSPRQQHDQRAQQRIDADLGQQAANSAE